MPFGRNRITTTNKRPCRYSQVEGNCSEMLDFAQLTITAPAAAHASTRRPPSATQITISIDGTIPSRAGEMMPTTGTNSAPASPAMPAAST